MTCPALPASLGETKGGYMNKFQTRRAIDEIFLQEARGQATDSLSVTVDISVKAGYNRWNDVRSIRTNRPNHLYRILKKITTIQSVRITIECP